MKKAFDKVHMHYDSFMNIFNLYKENEIFEALNLSGNETILDIGGGTGYLAKKLIEHCRKVYVLDESKNMLSKLQPTAGIIPINGDAFELSEIHEGIDIIILSDVFHHIKDQELLIHSIYEKLNPGGRLLIMDFHKKHPKVKLLMIFEYILFGKLYFRTNKELKEIVNKKFQLSKYCDYKYYFIIVGERIW